MKQKSYFRHRNKLFLKFTSLLLVFTLIFTSLPLTGLVASAESAEEDLITIVEELEEYRTEFSKTFCALTAL